MSALEIAKTRSVASRQALNRLPDSMRRAYRARCSDYAKARQLLAMVRALIEGRGDG